MRTRTTVAFFVLQLALIAVAAAALFLLRARDRADAPHRDAAVEMSRALDAQSRAAEARELALETRLQVERRRPLAALELAERASDLALQSDDPTTRDLALSARLRAEMAWRTSPAFDHGGYPTDARLSPTEAVLAVTDGRGATLYSTITGERLGRLAHETTEASQQVRISHDGRRLITFVGDAVDEAFTPARHRYGAEPPVLWTRDGRRLAALEAAGTGVTGAAMSETGVLVTGGSNGEAHLWALDDGRHLRALPGHAGDVFEVAVTADGTRVATVSQAREPARPTDDDTRAGTVGVFDADGRALYRIDTRVPFTRADIAADLSRAVTWGERRGRIDVWDLVAGARPATLELDSHITAARLSPDGRRLAVALLHGAIELYALDGTASRQATTALSRYELQSVIALTWTDDALLAGTTEGIVDVLDVDSLHLLDRLDAHGLYANVVVDGTVGGRTRSVVTAGHDGVVRVHDLDADIDLRPQVRPLDPLARCLPRTEPGPFTLTPDGRARVVVLRHHNGTSSVVHQATTVGGGLTLAVFEVPHDDIDGVALHGDLVVLHHADGAVSAWRPLEGRQAERVSVPVGARVVATIGLNAPRLDRTTPVGSHGRRQIASPDGRHQLLDDDLERLEVQTAGGRTVVTLEPVHGVGFSHATFSPDGRLLAAVDTSGVVQLVSVASGVTLATWTSTPSWPDGWHFPQAPPG